VRKLVSSGSPCEPKVGISPEAVAAVHGEFFRDVRPVNTIMEVSRVIDPDWPLEIEADPVVDDEA
jgi:enamine deaminase RidA (YjgF/YER057c/UK114 family)